MINLTSDQCTYRNAVAIAVKLLTDLLHLYVSDLCVFILTGAYSTPPDLLAVMPYFQWLVGGDRGSSAPCFCDSPTWNLLQHKPSLFNIRPTLLHGGKSYNYLDSSGTLV